MHERKALMADRADAFVALPGGVGTIEELIEALTWTQLRIHDKPVGLLDAGGYWGPLRATLDWAVEAEFVRPGHRAMLLADDDPAALLDALAAWSPRACRSSTTRRGSDPQAPRPRRGRRRQGQHHRDEGSRLRCLSRRPFPPKAVPPVHIGPRPGPMASAGPAKRAGLG